MSDQDQPPHAADLTKPDSVWSSYQHLRAVLEAEGAADEIVALDAVMQFLSLKPNKLPETDA